MEASLSGRGLHANGRTLLTGDVDLPYAVDLTDLTRQQGFHQSLSSVPGICVELTLRISTGLSAGLTFFQVGSVGMSLGSLPAAVLIAACTSCAAVSILLSRVNCRVSRLEPRHCSTSSGSCRGWR
jgi:hypothetical protein